MKTYNHIKGVLFSLLFSFVFFSCNNIFQPLKPEKPAEGTGYLSLSIGGVRVGRTILPLTEVKDFKSYGLVFSINNEELAPLYLTNDNLSEKISLPVGTYNLKVTAYMDDNHTKPAAEGNADIQITPGDNPVKLTLQAVITEGTGTFSWNITYPSGVSTANMTITPLGEGDVKSFNLLKEESKNPFSTELNVGYYRVLIKLVKSDGQETAEIREILHIYPNMVSGFDHTFEDSHFTRALFVTNGQDYDATAAVPYPIEGSLRWAIDQAIGRGGGTIIVDSSVGAIWLKKLLSINTSVSPAPYCNITIEGNGVTITKDPSWDEDSPESLLKIEGSGGGNLTMRRIHFKDGGNDSYARGGAICKETSLPVLLESCIFSGNKAASGGAIYNSGENLMVTGCTFYGNSAATQGGAIYNDDSATLYLTGNLFYGNTGGTRPVVDNYNGDIEVSGGCNVVDVKFEGPDGDDTAPNLHCGWRKNNDKYVPNPTVMHNTFKLLPDSEAAGIITDSDFLNTYPTADFYGYPITAGAAAGAVQETE